MKKTKTRRINARITEETYQIIKNSDYNFSEALDWFAGNLTNEDNQKYIQLKILEEETEFLRDKLLQNEVKIMEIQDDIGDKGITGKEYNKPVVRAVHNTISYYKRSYEEIYSINDFLETKEDYLKQNANRCGLKVEELKELVLNKYNEELNQKTLI